MGRAAMVGDLRQPMKMFWNWLPKRGEAGIRRGWLMPRAQLMIKTYFTLILLVSLPMFWLFRPCPCFASDFVDYFILLLLLSAYCYKKNNNTIILGIISLLATMDNTRNRGTHSPHATIHPPQLNSKPLE